MPPPGYAHLAAASTATAHHLQPLRPPPTLRQPPVSSAGAAEMEANRRWVSDLTAEVQRLTEELTSAQSASASLEDRLKDEQQRNLEKTLQLQELSQSAAKCEQLQASLSETAADLDQVRARLAGCRCRPKPFSNADDDDHGDNDQTDGIAAILEIKDSIIEKQQAFVKDLEKRLAESQEQNRQQTTALEAELASVRASLAEKSQQLEAVLFPDESDDQQAVGTNIDQRTRFCRQELEQLRQELLASQSELNRCRIEQDNLKEELTEAQNDAQLHRSTAAAAAMDAAKVTELSHELDNIRSANTELKSRLEAGEVKIRDLNSLLNYRERLVEQAKAETVEAEKKLADAKTDAAAKATALGEAKTQIAGLEAKLHEMEETLAAYAEMESALAAAEAAKTAAETELASIKEANAAYELKMKRFASVFQDAKKELEAREKLVDKLSQQVKELRTDNEAKRSELFAIKAKLEKRQDCEELLRCSERKLIALEREHAALTEHYEHLVAAKPNSTEQPSPKRPRLAAETECTTDELAKQDCVDMIKQPEARQAVEDTERLPTDETASSAT